MTAKQRANRERFKKVVAEAKKLRKKNPKLTQAQAVKQAWAISYGKKRAVLGAAKKKVTTKKSSSYHKDTKSHNVNIRVISGVNRSKNFAKISAKEKTWFRYYVNGFYGKKGVQAESLKNKGFTRSELNKRLNMFFKIQYEKGPDSWSGGDSIDRERFRNMFLMDQVKKGITIY